MIGLVNLSWGVAAVIGPLAASAAHGNIDERIPFGVIAALCLAVATFMVTGRARPRPDASEPPASVQRRHRGSSLTRRGRLSMKAKLDIRGIALAAIALVVALAPAVAPAHARTTRAASCGPKVSLMLWPKGYDAYPLPTFEVFRGVSGPYGQANILAYGSAARDGALGYPATLVRSDCLDYGSAGTLSAAGLGAKVTGARLACSFPKAPTVTVKRLAGQAKRVRLVLPPAAVVAEATVTPTGSSVKYAARYCTRKHALVEPSS